MVKKTEVQDTLPGIPPAQPTQMWRVNFQYQGPNYALRQGSLIIPADNIATARIVANGTLKEQLGDKWFNVTKIATINPEEKPF